MRLPIEVCKLLRERGMRFSKHMDEAIRQAVFDELIDIMYDLMDDSLSVDVDCSRRPGRWIAMDRDGSVNWFVNRPTLGEHEWLCDDGLFEEVTRIYGDSFHECWRRSLIKVPDDLVLEALERQREIAVLEALEKQRSRR